MKGNEKVKNRPDLPWDDSYGDHIRIIDNLFDENICNECINRFNYLEDKGLTTSRREHGIPNLAQADQQIFYTSCDASINEPLQDVVNYINNEIIESWQIKYPIIDFGTYDGLFTSQIKMQKTRPTEGYHQWHSESGTTIYDRNSILAFMVYLNDVDEGGETEFLYQSVRVPPRQGRFVCWPAGWTHIHRGNPPLKNDKYVLTGWINYTLK